MARHFNGELYHHGIKGMKWGVRHKRDHTSGGFSIFKKRATTNPEEPEEPDSEDYTQAHSGKSMRSMSNDELRAVNNRLQMEQQYKNLTTSEGKKWAERVLVGVATTVVTARLLRGTNTGIDKAVEAGKNLVTKSPPLFWSTAVKSI